MPLVSSSFARALLQTQAAASPACEGHATLAGISVGGWIALATFAGIIVGIVATLLVQACCWRPAQEARAQAYKVADEDVVASGDIDKAATRGPGRYYAPLTSGTGTGQVGSPQMLSNRESRDTPPRSFSSKPYGTPRDSRMDAATGDVASAAVADQKRTSGVAQQAKAVLASAGAQNASPVLSMQTVAAHEAQMQQQQRPSPRNINGRSVDHSAAALQRFGAVAALQVVSPSSSLSLSEVSTQPSQRAPAHTAKPTQVGRPQPGPTSGRPALQPQQQPQPPPQQPMTAQRQGGQQQQLRPPSADSAGTARTQGASELESEYELEDLDDDWKALLNDLDGRLSKRGASPMAPRERAVAIKKLLVATGSRGVDFAMQATLDEVLRFRRFSVTGAN